MQSAPATTAPHRTPPGPKGHPLFGSALDYMRDPLAFMLDARRRHGGLVGLPLKVMTMYLVSDPALIEQVLVTDNKSYIKDQAVRRIGREILGQGLLTTDGEHWRRQRRLAQPAFHRERITRYAELMAECAEEYVSLLRVGDTRDLQRDMLKLTLRIVLRSLLSIETAGTEAEIADAFHEISERHSVGIFMALPFLTRLPLPRNRRFARAVRRLDEIVNDTIRGRRAEGDATGRTDLLAMLLSARDQDGSRMSDVQLRDEIITMFSGGYETTALALSYGLLMLSHHPEAARALADELSSVLGGRAPTFADLPSLRYTEAVLLETMRLYPPAWCFSREAAQDTELGGYAIPRGAQVHISPWVVHRDPEVFAEPQAFRPERWLDGLQQRIPRFAYLPFGGGPRQCIGHAFAMTEASLILATIAGRFRMRATVAPEALRFRLGLSMQSRHGVPARVEPL